MPVKKLNEALTILLRGCNTIHKEVMYHCFSRSCLVRYKILIYLPPYDWMVFGIL